MQPLQVRALYEGPRNASNYSHPRVPVPVELGPDKAKASRMGLVYGQSGLAVRQALGEGREEAAIQRRATQRAEDQVEEGPSLEKEPSLGEDQEGEERSTRASRGYRERQAGDSCWDWYHRQCQ